MRLLVRFLGFALIIVGIALPSLFVFEHREAGRETKEANRALRSQVPDSPEPRRVASPVEAGEPLAVIRIPRFGASWEWVVLEGTSDDVIANGPGHYAGTALPGARGNAAFAAHRAGHGDPFINFDDLRAGDKVVIQQGRQRWVYLVEMKPRIIEPTDVWVLDPLPGRRLTLTTCWPKYGSSHRMYVTAVLAQ